MIDVNSHCVLQPDAPVIPLLRITPVVLEETVLPNAYPSRTSSPAPAPAPAPVRVPAPVPAAAAAPVVTARGGEQDWSSDWWQHPAIQSSATATTPPARAPAPAAPAAAPAAEVDAWWERGTPEGSPSQALTASGASLGPSAEAVAALEQYLLLADRGTDDAFPWLAQQVAQKLR